jgi:small subunit ribosomal protein S21
LAQVTYNRRIRLATVKVRKGEDINRALRRLKRKIEREGIIQEIKKRRYYSKPSVAKKEKRERAEKRRRKSKARMNKRNKRN